MRKTLRNTPAFRMDMAMPHFALGGEGEYSRAFRQGLERAHPLLQERLRNAARDLDWPEDLVQNLHLTLNNGSLAVTVPDAVAEQVWDEEYGDTNRVPKPAIRKFADSKDWHEALIAAVMQEIGA